jgi:hypothetical protein
MEIHDRRRRPPDRRRSLADVVPFPSEAWFDEAAARLAGDDELARLSRGVHLLVQQTVTDPGGDTVWHIRIADGEVALCRGPAAQPTVTFTCDAATAEAIRLSTTSTQSVFMAGRLRVGGDVGALLRHQELLGSLAGVVGPLRAGTS